MLKLGELADQSGAADPLLFQGDQADDRGGGHAASRPDQPDANARLRHGLALRS